VSAFKVGDRVRYTYQSPLGSNRFLPPFGREGTVQPDPIGYAVATHVLFDDWQDPLRSIGNTMGAFFADNDDLELIP